MAPRHREPARASEGAKADDAKTGQLLLEAVQYLYRERLLPLQHHVTRVMEELTGLRLDRKRFPDIVAQLPQLDLQQMPGERCVVRLANVPDDFVDADCPEDPYPQETWSAFLHEVAEKEKELAAGKSQGIAKSRFEFARWMKGRLAQRLGEKDRPVLGELCHMVQIAIRQRQLLDYCDGWILPKDSADVPRKCSASNVSSPKQPPLPVGNSSVALPLRPGPVAQQADEKQATSTLHGGAAASARAPGLLSRLEAQPPREQGKEKSQGTLQSAAILGRVPRPFTSRPQADASPISATCTRAADSSSGCGEEVQEADCSTYRQRLRLSGGAQLMAQGLVGGLVARVEGARKPCTWFSSTQGCQLGTECEYCRAASPFLGFFPWALNDPVKVEIGAPPGMASTAARPSLWARVSGRVDLDEDPSSESRASDEAVGKGRTHWCI